LNVDILKVGDLDFDKRTKHHFSVDHQIESLPELEFIHCNPIVGDVVHMYPLSESFKEKMATNGLHVRSSNNVLSKSTKTTFCLTKFGLMTF
jgi:hypothetical protein